MVDRKRITDMDLRRDLAALGVGPGLTLTVHSSLSAIGWVDGGPATVVRALLDAIGKNGTLAMPAATPQCAVPKSVTADTSIDAESVPVFDMALTPTPMGAIAECFRSWPGTLRSNHPLESVCANGPLAGEIITDHPLAFSEGPGTPFGKLHEMGSWILLLGVGFNRCTALHHAETLVDKRRTTTVRFAVMIDNVREWIEVPNVADDNDRHFPIIGERFVAAGKAKVGAIGEAPSTLFAMKDLVNFAVEYFDEVF